ncbi:MAG TPA: GYF domain-containing protein [Polyangiales bacterium]|jgi:predicted Zn finger-like uncharacterized protein|nr:GYF domain-containing protein [Polyangiales bacterium]
MKIVCGSCQAKYSIADEKVTGKVFKIRCKRCSEVIVVRGDEQGAAPADAGAAGAAYDAAADAIWHVVINGEQAGPYSPQQLGEMLTSGHVDWEAYVWCEGFDNWAAMRDVPDLVAAITGQGQQSHTATAAGGFAAQPSMGADPFADEGGGGGGGLFSDSSQSSARGSSNLFGGGAQESPFDGGGGGGVVASAPSPRVSVEQAMTGARNENSVLFSLKNLQALATGNSGTPATAAAGPAPMGPGNRPGFAGGEGSGLIDIRALASATGVSAGESAREESDKDALLSLGSAQTGAFGALGSPMLAPASSDDDSGKKGVMLAIFGGFAMVAVAVVVVAFLFMRQQPVQAPAMAPVAPPPAAAAAAVNPTAAPAAPAPAEPPSEGELAAKRAAENAAAPAEKTTSGSHSTKRTTSSSEKSSGGSEPVAKSEPSPAKESAAPSKPKGGSSSIDELLDGAIGGGSSKGAKKEAPAPVASNLPEKPSRDDVLSAMNGVKDDVKACGKGQTGVAFANVSVSGKTGRVTNAEITGITGEAGSCIARAVRKATFPKFQSDSFQVKFPFKL